MSSFLLHKAKVSEDALTGVLTDILSWWPERAVAMLSRARRFDGETASAPVGIRDGHVGALVVRPWPRWPSGEPDLVLEFQDGPRRSLLIIEAKLGAPKSSENAGEELPEEDAVVDQLGKYFRDAVRGRDRQGGGAPHRVDVVYLTHHAVIPRDDLVASHRVVAGMRGDAGGDLYWLSWRDIERTAAVEASAAEPGRREALAGLRAVLVQEGFDEFRGAWAPGGASSPPQPPAPVFWTSRFAWRGPGHVESPPTRVFFKQEG